MLSKRSRNTIAKLLIILVMLFSVVSVSSTYVYADRTSDDADEDRENTEEERDQNQSRLDATNSTIQSLVAEQSDVDQQIEEVETALVEVMTDMAVIESEIADKQVEIDEATVQLSEAMALEQEQYNAMIVRIKYLYESGNQEILTVILESGSITEALTRADYIESLYTYDRRMLTEYQDTVAMVQELKATLEDEQAQLVAMQEDYEEEAARMSDVIDELKVMSDDYAARIASAERTASQYAAIIAQQNKEIQELQAEANQRRAQEQAAAAQAAAAEAAANQAMLVDEEQRQAAEASMSEVAATGTVTAADNTTYDVTPIYSSGGSELGQSIASFACQFVGNPYVSGGTSLTNGADCSGFTMAVYQNFGYSLPRMSSAQRSVGVEVPYSQAQPGDIICYSGHVGIYIGDGMIVHASTPSGGIKIGSATFRTILSVRRIV